MKEFLLPLPDWNHYIFSLILNLFFFSPSEIPNDLVISECIHVCYVLFFKYFNYIAISLIYSVVLISVVKLSDLVMCDKSLQLCLTFFDPMDCSLPDYLCSWGFSRQEYQRGFPFPSPGDLPDPGIKPASLMSPALAGGSLPLGPPAKSCSYTYIYSLFSRLISHI